jgi:ABC-2 type transport system ATP-binding protein
VTVAGFDVATQAANVRESISLTGRFGLRRVKDAGHVADDLLARFQLTAAARRRVATYSGGMRRRLDIAMSLIGNPPVIFLDDPTTELDPQGRIEVWHTVRELAGQGTTVLHHAAPGRRTAHRPDRPGVSNTTRDRRRSASSRGAGN